MIKISPTLTVIALVGLVLLMACRPPDDDFVQLLPSQTIAALPTAAVAIELENEPTASQISLFEPVKLTFDDPVQSLQLTQDLSSEEIIIYEFGAPAGRYLNVRLDNVAQDVSLAIIAPNASILKTGEDQALGWQGVLPDSGTYQIQITAGSTPTHVTLQLNLLSTKWLADDFTRMRVPFSHGVFDLTLDGQSLDAIYFQVDRLRLIDPAGTGRSYSLKVPQSAPIPLAFPQTILLSDMNYDGRLDLGLLAIISQTGELFYNVWLYDDVADQFVWQEDLPLISSPHFIGDGRVESRFRPDPATQIREVFQWEGDLLEKTFEESCRTEADGTITHQAMQITDRGENELFRLVGNDCSDFGQTDPLLAVTPAEEPAGSETELGGDNDLADNLKVINDIVMESLDGGGVVIPITLIQGVDELIISGQWQDDDQTVYQISQIDLQQNGQSRQTLDIRREDGIRLADSHAIQIEDYNYDGLSDLAILKSTAENGDPTYDIFLYEPDSASFVRHVELSTLITPERLGDNVLRTTFTTSEATLVADIYEWAGAELHLLIRETCQPTANGTFVHTGYQFDANQTPTQTFQVEGAECVEFGEFD